MAEIAPKLEKKGWYWNCRAAREGGYVKSGDVKPQMFFEPRVLHPVLWYIFITSSMSDAAATNAAKSYQASRNYYTLEIWCYLISKTITDLRMWFNNVNCASNLTGTQKCNSFLLSKPPVFLSTWRSHRSATKVASGTLLPAAVLKSDTHVNKNDFFSSHALIEEKKKKNHSNDLKLQKRFEVQHFVSLTTSGDAGHY